MVPVAGTVCVCVCVCELWRRAGGDGAKMSSRRVFSYHYRSTWDGPLQKEIDVQPFLNSQNFEKFSFGLFWWFFFFRFFPFKVAAVRSSDRIFTHHSEGKYKDTAAAHKTFCLFLFPTFCLLWILTSKRIKKKKNEIKQQIIHRLELSSDDVFLHHHYHHCFVFTVPLLMSQRAQEEILIMNVICPGLQRDAERWTLCLRHRCLVLKHGDGQRLTHVKLFIWSSWPLCHHHLFADSKDAYVYLYSSTFFMFLYLKLKPKSDKTSDFGLQASVPKTTADHASPTLVTLNFSGFSDSDKRAENCLMSLKVNFWSERSSNGFNPLYYLQFVRVFQQKQPL